MKKIKKVIPVLAPVFAVGTVAWGAAASLGGHTTTPVYGAEEFQIVQEESDTSVPMVQEEEKSKPDKLEKLAVEETVAKAKGNFDLSDGDYSGTGEGYNGPVKVSVKIQSKSIASIDVVSHTDDEAFFNRAKAGVVESILSTQSLDVDTVSGATYSSNGIISAVKNAVTGETSSSSGGNSSSSGGASTTPVSIGQGNFDVADGTYQGSAQGYAGLVNVSVGVKSRSIVSVDIVSHSDDESFFNRAKAGVVASILSSQSLEVDTVSGATYSSRGIINAVKNAISGQAGTASDPQQETPVPTAAPTSVPNVKEADAYKDGTYTGKGTGFGGELTVSVKISGGKIKNIKILKHNDGDEYIQKASVLIQSILDKQSTNVDTISGATYSSNGILEAVREALGKAAVTKKKPKTTTVPQKSSTPTAVPTVVPAGSFPYPDGSYTGIGEGYGGDISVVVVIQNKTIKEVRITEHDGEDDVFFNKAKVLADQVVQRQSTELDVVSGATYSSNGILEGIRNALEEAKKASDKGTPTPTAEPTVTPTAEPTVTPTVEPTTTPTAEPTPVPSEPEEDTSVYVDGQYTVTVPCVPDDSRAFSQYNLTLTVVIKNDRITEVRNVFGDGGSGNDSYIKRAVSGTTKYPGVVNQIVEKNGVDGVDTVSRATCTSESILEACRQALKQAER